VLLLKQRQLAGNLDEYLGILNYVVAIKDNEHAFVHELNSSDRLFIIVAVLPEHNSAQVGNFNQINFQQHARRVEDNINVFYIENQEFIMIERNRLGVVQRRLWSVTDNTLEKVVFICSGAFIRNIRYFDDRYHQSQQRYLNNLHRNDQKMNEKMLDEIEFYRKIWEQRVELEIDVLRKLSSVMFGQHF
jgi:hypothetical protein